MPKHAFIREQDEWLYFIDFFVVLAGASAIYASVPMFRMPALIFAVLGLWFSFHKMQRDYSWAKARTHLGAVLISSGLLAYIIYLLTN